MSKQLEFFGYCRASTDDQKITLLDQEDKIKNYCAYKNYKLLDIFIDGGVSGSVKTTERPEMKKLLEKLQKGEGDGLICTKIDRLSRSSGDFVNVMNYFNKNNIQLIFLDPEIDTKSATGKMILTIMSSVAELELNMIRERTRNALRKKKEKGECYGQVPYGYDKDADNNLIENVKEQKNIKLVKDLYKQGLNYNKICEHLIENDIERKPCSKKWFPTQISRIILEGEEKIQKKRKQFI